MSRYDVEVNVERDADGRITRGKVAWAETRPWLNNMFLMVGTMAMFATAAGVLWLLAAQTMNPLLGYGLLGLGASAWLLFGLPGEKRAVIFLPDGQMLTPHGIYYRPMLPAIGGHHSHLVSIEARLQRDQPEQGGQMFEVIMLSQGGDMICVSRNLHEWIALRAAAQLTQMLNRIREEQADIMMGDVRIEFS